MVLAEISERDAEGEIARLYAAIREQSGSPIVNYIWRHLATIDGAAPWCWSLVQSNDIDPFAAAIAREADEAAASVQKLLNSEIPPLSSSAHAIIELYNHNNVQNLARVLLLRQALEHPRSAQFGRELRNWRAPSPAPRWASDVPPLPSVAELSPEDRDSCEALTAAGPARESGVPPSLWRHLGAHPGIITRLRKPMREALDSHAFASAFADFWDRALLYASETHVAMPAPQKFDRGAARDGLERFSRRIAEMAIAGRVLI